MDNTAIALKQLKQHGYRVTKQRESMVDYLGRNQHRYTAVTILDRYMRTQFPGVSHDTIYRNVKSFIEMGIVESRIQHPHHHHFICTNCGKVIELKMCPLNYFEEQVPGAKIQSHNFELYGLCAACQEHADRLKNANR